MRSLQDVIPREKPRVRRGSRDSATTGSRLSSLYRLATGPPRRVDPAAVRLFTESFVFGTFSAQYFPCSCDTLYSHPENCERYRPRTTFSRCTGVRLRPCKLILIRFCLEYQIDYLFFFFSHRFSESKRVTLMLVVSRFYNFANIPWKILIR